MTLLGTACQLALHLALLPSRLEDCESMEACLVFVSH